MAMVAAMDVAMVAAVMPPFLVQATRSFYKKLTIAAFLVELI